MLLGIKPTVDFVFKKVFGSPENVPVLIGLLNAILKLAHPIVHVEILNPFSRQEFADEKLVVLDIRARDSAGRWLNIEMQVTVFAGLLQRLVYYACTMYVGQLESGQNYADLRSAISICLLNKKLFRDDTVPHHRFRLADPEHGVEISDSVEVHTLELTKYNLQEATISSAPAIEQWAFFFLFADRYEPERLRELLPGVEFQQAISVVEAIAAKTEDRMMYDQRLKAQRDYQWGLDSARQEGMEKGMEKGMEEGMEKGRKEGRKEGEAIGKIQLLQELLGDESSSPASLHERPIGELSAMLADLQQRLRSRES
jgi:predicted transposase/invertase (TIGR01784 family)